MFCFFFFFLFFKNCSRSKRLADVDTERKRRAFREILDSSVRRSEKDWSQVKRKVSHRSAFSNLTEEEARKTWEQWSKSDDSSKSSSSSKRERSRSRDDRDRDRDRDRSKRAHDDKREEGEIKN